MTQIYLYLNAALYFLLALRATFAAKNSATGLGYLTMSESGRSEYLVAYGGLLIGLSIVFLLLARHTADLSFGLRIAVGFYAPIVLYRVGTSIFNWPISGSTLGTIGVEAIMLSAAIWLVSRN